MPAKKSQFFEKLGFNAVFFGDVISGSDMPNLMYMTTFVDRESRDAHWTAFVDSPEWKSNEQPSEVCEYGITRGYHAVVSDGVF